MHMTECSVAGTEQPSEFRTQAEVGKQVARDVLAMRFLHGVVAAVGQIHPAGIADRQHIRITFEPILHLPVHRVGAVAEIHARALPGPADHRQFVGLPDTGKRAQQGGIDE